MASGFLETGLDRVEGVEGAVHREASDGTGLECKISVNQFHMDVYIVTVTAYKQRSGPKRDQCLCFVLLSHGGMAIESMIG